MWEKDVNDFRLWSPGVFLVFVLILKLQVCMADGLHGDRVSSPSPPSHSITDPGYYLCSHYGPARLRYLQLRARRFLLAPAHPQGFLIWFRGHLQSFWGPPRVLQRAYEMRLRHLSLFHVQYFWHAVWAAISPCVHHCAEGQSFHVIFWGFC